MVQPSISQSMFYALKVILSTILKNLWLLRNIHSSHIVIMKDIKNPPVKKPFDFYCSLIIFDNATPINTLQNYFSPEDNMGKRLTTELTGVL